jgi:hypothetical protein
MGLEGPSQNLLEPVLATEVGGCPIPEVEICHGWLASETMKKPRLVAPDAVSRRAIKSEATHSYLNNLRKALLDSREKNHDSFFR